MTVAASLSTPPHAAPRSAAVGLLLNKLLPVLLLPLGLALLLSAAGLLLRRRWLTVTGLLILIVASLPAVSRPLLASLENRYPRTAPADAPAADAIIMLAGAARSGFDPAAGAEWTEAVERFDRSVDLFLAGRAPVIVVADARTPWRSATGDGALMRDLFASRGVPREAIITGGEAVNTADEARQVARLAREHGWKRILLVTTAWHLPRSVLVFEQAGLTVSPFPADFQLPPGVPLAIVDFVPDAEALRQTQIALRERYGILYYRLRPVAR